MSFQANSQSGSADAADSAVPCNTSNCPFWGSTSRMNLCSQCYKDKLKADEEIRMAKVNNEEGAAEQEMDLDLNVNLGLVQSKKNISSTSSINANSTAVSNIESSHQNLMPSSSHNKPVEKNEQNIAWPKAETNEVKNVENLPPPTPVTKLEEVPKRIQKDRRRCLECNKFLGFTGIKCKCGFVFCGIHRYPEKHNCDFDFEARARTKFLQNRTEAAVADKIEGERL